MSNEIDQFTTLWDSFSASVRSRLEEECKKQPLSYSICTLILNDEKLSWSTDDNPFGQWLEELRKTKPVKADLILSIIMDDMKFSEPDKKSPITLRTILGVGVIPLVLALAAMWLCSVCFHTSFAVTLAVELGVEIAALLAFFLSPFSKSSTKSQIDIYVAQLDKYKRVITEILVNEPEEC